MNLKSSVERAAMREGWGNCEDALYSTTPKKELPKLEKRLIQARKFAKVK